MSFCLFVCFLLHWFNFQIRFLSLQWWLAELGCRKRHHVSHWPNSSHPQPLHILLPLQHENTTFVLDIKRGNVCITGRLEHLSLLFPACSPIIHHHLSLLFPACSPIIHHQWNQKLNMKPKKYCEAKFLSLSFYFDLFYLLDRTCLEKASSCNTVTVDYEPFFFMSFYSTEWLDLLLVVSPCLSFLLSYLSLSSSQLCLLSSLGFCI